MNKLIKNPKWLRILFIAGIVCIILGILDPLEGSVVILAGSIFLAASSFLTRDPQWKVFTISAVMILIGVSFLFYLSSLGGFGGNSGKSWWWGTLILPYPLGWLAITITLIIRLIKRKN